MAAHAVVCPNIDGLYGINYPGFQFFMQFYIVVVVTVIFKINTGFPVAVYTPAHGKIAELFHNIHFLDRPVAFAAVYSA